MTWRIIIDITWPSRQCRRCWQSPSGSLLSISRSNLIQNFFCVFICAQTVSSGRWWRVMWRQERSFNFIFLSFWCYHCCRWSTTSVFTRHFCYLFWRGQLNLGLLQFPIQNRTSARMNQFSKNTFQRKKIMSDGFNYEKKSCIL